jgi:hypothetical protein
MLEILQTFLGIIVLLGLAFWTWYQLSYQENLGPQYLEEFDLPKDQDKTG